MKKAVGHVFELRNVLVSATNVSARDLSKSFSTLGGIGHPRLEELEGAGCVVVGRRKGVVVLSLIAVTGISAVASFTFYVVRNDVLESADAGSIHVKRTLF